MQTKIAASLAIILSIAGCAYSIIYVGSPARWIISGGLIVMIFLLIWLVRAAIVPVNHIVSGMDLLRAQDFASRLRPVGQFEADSLSSTFNMMMDTLHSERSRVLEQNNYLGLLVEASPMGVINFDFDGHIIALNPSAAAMLELTSPADVIGHTLDNLPGRIGKGLSGIADGESRSLRSGSTIVGASFSHFIDRGAKRPFLMLVRLDEEMRLAERRGYTTAIRTMAHEVNNSIGAVDSALQTLENIMADASLDKEEAEDARALIDSSRERMHSAGEFIGSFAALARLPEPSMEVVDMAHMINRVVPVVRALCDAADVELEVDARAGAFIDRADPSQMEQVIVNLVKNAVESIVSTGRTDGKVTIRVDLRTIYVTDNGAGISDSDAANALANPFFTTKPQGQGIGLTLSTEIIRAHHWRCSLATDSATGITTFTINGD